MARTLHVTFFFVFFFVMCSFVGNNGHVFTNFYLGVVFLFVNSNNGGGLLTFRTACQLDLCLDSVLVPL